MTGLLIMLQVWQLSGSAYLNSAHWNLAVMTHLLSVKLFDPFTICEQYAQTVTPGSRMRDTVTLHTRVYTYGFIQAANLYRVAANKPNVTGAR